MYKFHFCKSSSDFKFSKTFLQNLIIEKDLW